jgi:hypothetical protein
MLYYRAALEHLDIMHGSGQVENFATILICLSTLVVTYDHRLKRIGHPVRSAIHKLQIGRLVVGWVTTSEYLLLYVFAPFFLFVPTIFFLAPIRVISSVDLVFGTSFLSFYYHSSVHKSQMSHRRPACHHRTCVCTEALQLFFLTASCACLLVLIAPQFPSVFRGQCSAKSISLFKSKLDKFAVTNSLFLLKIKRTHCTISHRACGSTNYTVG